MESSKKNAGTKSRFIHDIILGAIIPFVFFRLIKYQYSLEAAAYAVTIYGIILFLYYYIVQKRIEPFAYLTLFIGLIELIVLIFTKSTNDYFWVTPISNFLMGMVFLITLLMPKSIFQLFAESASPQLKNSPFNKTEYFKKTWQYLTILLGLINIIQAIIQSVVLLFGNINLFIEVKYLFGIPLTIAMVIFCVWFTRKRFAYMYRQSVNKK